MNGHFINLKVRHDLIRDVIDYVIESPAFAGGQFATKFSKESVSDVAESFSETGRYSYQPHSGSIALKMLRWKRLNGITCFSSVPMINWQKKS